MGNAPLHLENGSTYTITVTRTDREAAPAKKPAAPEPKVESATRSAAPAGKPSAPAGKPSAPAGNPAAPANDLTEIPADPPIELFAELPSNIAMTVWEQELIGSVDDEDDSSEPDGDIILEEYKLDEARMSPGYVPFRRHNETYPVAGNDTLDIKRLAAHKACIWRG